MQATMEGIGLMEASFVDLVTYKKDGTPVSTPMLSTPRGEVLLLRTHHTAGKLKRLSRNVSVELAPLSRGRHVGAVTRGTARILSDAETAECLELLHRRHGMVGRFATLLRHMRGWRDVFIEVRPA